MNRILVIFLFVTTFLKGQTIIDSISINPNPFQNRTLINYSFTNNDTVTINIINVVGATVLSLFTNSIIPTGIYQDSLIMNTYADGIYFVQLKLGNRKSIMKKIIKSTSAGIKENKEDNVLNTLFPNPLNGVLNIEFEKAYNREDIEYQIINNTGKILKVGKIMIENKRVIINIDDLPMGIYLINLKNTSKRFIVTNQK